MRNTTKTLTGVAVAATLVLTACSGPDDRLDDSDSDLPDGFSAYTDPSTESAGGVLSVQLDYDTAETGGLDPATAEIARSWTIMGLVYESLVSIGPNFEIEPELASSWEQPDETTYVFDLQPGAAFSNGRSVSADDVVGSLERLLETGALWGGQLGPIASIENTSEGGVEQVTISLERPYTPLLAALANTPAGILPMQELDEGEFDPAEEMLGSGAFAAVEHRQDEYWVFEANPEWWNAESLGIDELRIDISGDDQTRLAGLRDGSTQFANFSNPDALSLLESAQGVTAASQTQSDFFYLMFNALGDSPMAEQETRQLVNAAIDREQLVDVALAGAAMPTGVTPVNLPDACVPDSLPSATTEVATDALAGLSLSLLVYNSDPSLVAMGQVVQQQLQAAGAAVELESLDYGSYADRVYAAEPGQFDLALGWFAGYADPSMVTSWWDPDTALFNAGFMESHDDLNAAIEEARTLAPGEERAGAFQTVCELVDEYSEMVPLATRPQVVGYRSDSLGITLLSDEGYGDFLRGIADFRILGS